MSTEQQPHPQSPARAKSLSAITRGLLLGLAVLSLAIGILGIFLPVLPTVPFILLAAWAAGHSSPRLSHWLENHPQFGLHIRDWRHSGRVSRKANWLATVAMSASALTTLLLTSLHWAALTGVAAMACVLVWLWRRPEQARS